MMYKTSQWKHLPSMMILRQSISIHPKQRKTCRILFTLTKTRENLWTKSIQKMLMSLKVDNSVITRWNIFYQIVEINLWQRNQGPKPSTKLIHRGKTNKNQENIITEEQKSSHAKHCLPAFIKYLVRLYLDSLKKENLW